MEPNALAEAFRLMLRETEDRLARQMVETHNANVEMDKLKARIAELEQPKKKGK
jgi:hypothetical protein